MKERIKSTMGNSAEIKPSTDNPPFNESLIESPSLIRGEFFDALEKTMMAKIDKRSPKLPEIKNTILIDGDQKIAEIEQIRKFEKPRFDSGILAHQDLWLVVDFDDVINYTSTYMNDLQSKISETTGIPIIKLYQLYKESKISNDEGKEVFMFNNFVNKIKEELRNLKNNEVDEIVNNIDYNQYVDQSIKRAILACRFVYNKVSHYSSARDATVRISMLTYGEIEYQKSRVHKSGISDIFDEIIYTEGSKREVIDAITRRDYKKDKLSAKIYSPNLITFDDSPEQVDDLQNIKNSSNHINVRVYNPQAKRYKTLHSANEVVKSDEDSNNQAAIDIFSIAQMSLMPETNQLLSPISAFDYTKIREEREKTFDGKEENITYRKEGNLIIREYVPLHFSYVTNSWEKYRKETDTYNISNEGTLSQTPRRLILEEYIKYGNGKN